MTEYTRSIIKRSIIAGAIILAALCYTTSTATATDRAFVLTGNTECLTDHGIIAVTWRVTATGDTTATWSTPWATDPAMQVGSSAAATLTYASAADVVADVQVSAQWSDDPAPVTLSGSVTVPTDCLPAPEPTTTTTVVPTTTVVSTSTVLPAIAGPAIVTPTVTFVTDPPDTVPAATVPAETVSDSVTTSYGPCIGEGCPALPATGRNGNMAVVALIVLLAGVALVGAARRNPQGNAT